ncbi:general odorant-binding protein 45-like [Armigeres subalbatus]|uniref:general odorant-binding protein 45-like n=1 Tax=Armigeres subalbatus TaxID=124917 RepID=UPI002ED44EEE
MNRLHSMVAIAVVALLGGVFARHDAVFKTFSSTSNECAKYLNNDGSGDCNIHCVGVVAHVWNDTVAKFTPNYANFFAPDAEDNCYENRTDRCMQHVDHKVPVFDKCARANQLGQCYADQYGELKSNVQEYVPKTDVQYTRVFLQCASILGLSHQDLQAMVQQGAYNVPAAACLLRCTLMRMGLYTDSAGVDVPLATRQCGLYNATENVEKCQARIQEEECDKCKRAVRIAKECLRMHFNVKPLGETFAVELYGTSSACAFCFAYYGLNAIFFCPTCPYLTYYTNSYATSSSSAGSSSGFTFYG